MSRSRALGASRGYRLMLNQADMQALAYIAGRYESGRVLYDHLELANAEDETAFRAGHLVEWKLDEVAAWAYQDALESENAVVPPLAGGHLQRELLALYNKIV